MEWKKTVVPGTLSTISDDELVGRVKDLVACERRASVALIRSLMEFDARRLYLREGCSSMFTYCTQVLHLSEGSAYNRIEAARLARRYPEVLVALERGDLTITAVRLLAPHLTAANYAEVLASARHKSKQAIQELVAALNPRPPAATLIRRETPLRAQSATVSVTDGAHPLSVSEEDCEAPTTTVRAPAAVVTPLAPEHYKLQVTLSRQTHEKLRCAQALMRHAVPNGDLASILDRALTLLIEDVERRKCARVAAPRPARSRKSTRGRYISAAVRRRVWQRDGGRCAFVGNAGRCRETGFLEFHHVDPYSAGGAATVENIQLRCAAHNQYESRVFFGASP